MRTLKSNADQGQKIDLFEESPLSKQFLKDNIDDIVAELSGQFKEPEDAYRELIQNCIDARTPQINVSTYVEPIDDISSLFVVDFEDYGAGMNISERNEFFLKLFKSSKENDKRKIGKYGIGISSIFALPGLDQVVVESSKKSVDSDDIESWRLRIKDIQGLPSHRYEDFDPRQGTRISLRKCVETSNLETHKSKVKEKVAFYCERSRTPIYVDDEFINKEFDLDTSLKISESKDGLEYVIGLAAGEGPHYEIFNNRLKLREGEQLFSYDSLLKDAEVIVSSNYFTHSFSRDDVVRDKHYEKILGILENSVDKLFLKSLELINFDRLNPIEAYSQAEPVLSLELQDGTTRRYFNYDINTLKKIIPSSTKTKNISPELVPAIDDTDFSISRSSNFALTPQEINSKIKDFTEDYDKFSKQREEHNAMQTQRRKEISAAWTFVHNYLNSTAHRLEETREGGNWFSRITKSVLNPSSFYEHLRKTLPSGTGKYNVFTSISHGELSIDSLLSHLSADDEVFSLGENQEKLMTVLAKDGKLLFDERVAYGVRSSTPYFSDHNTQNKKVHTSEDTLKLLVRKQSIPRAKTVYSLDIETERGISEVEINFLKALRKSIPRQDRGRIKRMYFTDDSKLEETHKKEIIYRNPQGKIGVGTSGKKDSFLRKIKDVFAGDVKQEVALNLDDPMIQKSIYLFKQPNEYSKGIALDILGKRISRDCPYY